MTTPAHDPDAIVLEACPPELATISLAGIVGCDPLTRPVVDALADGAELPEEFQILDTYADCGEPSSVWRIQRIRQEVRETLQFFGLPATLADRLPPASLEETLVGLEIL
jgi:hypothetical protein